MGNRFVQAVLLLVFFAAVEALPAQADGLIVEHGTYTIHLLLHAIGTEEYTVRRSEGGGLVLTTAATSSDRGMKRVTTSVLAMGPGFSPVSMQQSSSSAGVERRSALEVRGNIVSVREDGTRGDVARPAVGFVAAPSMSASAEMMLMRYWIFHHRPAELPVVRGSTKALPLEIRLVGHDAFYSKGHMVRLNRYTVANLVFGREIVWMNASGRLAAVMTFAGGLPQEEVLDEYEPLFGELEHSGVQQEMLDLDDLGRRVAPEAQGTYAIVGARLIDGTGAAAVQNATVVIRDGKIAAVGVSAPPRGMRVVHAEGKSLLPGLWEMHTHYSGVEFGPALLSAGVTTARDCGGELEFLAAVRRKIDVGGGLGPKLLLAGLIDSGGPLAFGTVDANTPEAAIAAVNMYADAKFQQIKVYTQIKPEVLMAITAEAHRRGLSVTGHVPAALNAFDGIADGMDQINHLQFVTRAMNTDGASFPVDLASDRAQRLLALLKARQIVVDATDSWSEMAGHPMAVKVASFEPGIVSAPDTLASRFEAMGLPPTEAGRFRERRETNRRVLGALHKAGVPLVAGSDTGLIGYGLDREMELYVQAGLTPMEAIQSATIVSARAMKMEGLSGSVEVGKLADLVLVDGNPLQNISDVRRVISVIKSGRMYDSRKLAESVGFVR